MIREKKGVSVRSHYLVAKSRAPISQVVYFARAAAPILVCTTPCRRRQTRKENEDGVYSQIMNIYTG